MEEAPAKKHRISFWMGVSLILVALFFDGFAAIATFFFPVVGGIVVDVIAIGVFGLWLWWLKIPLINPKQLLQWILNMAADMGTAGLWIGFTAGVIITIVVVYLEDRSGISVLDKIPTGKTSSMNAVRTERKVARRALNPERTARAQERLARMREQRAAGVSTLHERQPLRDIDFPKAA